MVSGKAKGCTVMLYHWSAQALTVLAFLSVGCERSDPLSAVPNSTGTAILEDKLIGSDARAICVTATPQDVCNSRHSEIYIENVNDLNDVRAKWIDANSVLVEVSSGLVRRKNSTSRNGQIQIRLSLDASPRRIIITHPDGNESISLPPS